MKFASAVISRLLLLWYADQVGSYQVTGAGKISIPATAAHPKFSFFCKVLQIFRFHVLYIHNIWQALGVLSLLSIWNPWGPNILANQARHAFGKGTCLGTQCHQPDFSFAPCMAESSDLVSHPTEMVCKRATDQLWKPRDSSDLLLKMKHMWSAPFVVGECLQIRGCRRWNHLLVPPSVWAYDMECLAFVSMFFVPSQGHSIEG